MRRAGAVRPRLVILVRFWVVAGWLWEAWEVADSLREVALLSAVEPVGPLREEAVFLR